MEALASSRIDSSRLRAITGIITLSSKLPLAPANVTVASLPITCAQTISVASGSTGLTLPGMMLDPGWRSGRWISARPVVGPRRHPAQVVADLGQADGDRAEHPAQLDERVAGALRLEVVAGLGERLAGVLGQRLDHPGGEAGRGVDAGADRGAAERQLARPGGAPTRAARPRSARWRRTRRTPGRASPASRPSGGCGRTSRGRRTRRPWPERLRSSVASAGSRSLADRDRRGHVDRRSGRCRCWTGWR